MPLTLDLKTQPTVPLEVEGVLPTRLQTLDSDAISAFEIYHGNQVVRLDEFFSIDGDLADGEIVMRGDLSRVHWIGAKMEGGRLRVEGNAGRHIGSEMRGGEIVVTGDAGDWVGGECHGGLIHIHGNAGHLVGAAYRGSARGMTGGTILVQGKVGNELGHTMRRGLIAVGGGCGDLVGFNMLAGTILVFGEAGIRHGAGMKRGTIAFFDERPEPLPSFRLACRYQPLAMTLVFRELQRLEFPLPQTIADAEFDLFNGDLIEGGRGEILYATTS